MATPIVRACCSLSFHAGRDQQEWRLQFACLDTPDLAKHVLNSHDDFQKNILSSKHAPSLHDCRTSDKTKNVLSFFQHFSPTADSKRSNTNLVTLHYDNIETVADIPHMYPITVPHETPQYVRDMSANKQGADSSSINAAFVETASHTRSIVLALSP